MVFAGYGITAPEYNYDDYAGIDVKGKIVLILRHEPQEFDEKSVFAGKVYTEHAQFFSKAANAKNHGARGRDSDQRPPGASRRCGQLEKFGADRRARPTRGIPFVQIKAEVAERWFGAGGQESGRDPAEIDKDLQAALVRLAASAADRRQRGRGARGQDRPQRRRVSAGRRPTNTS